MGAPVDKWLLTAGNAVIAVPVPRACGSSSSRLLIVMEALLLKVNAAQQPPLLPVQLANRALAGLCYRMVVIKVDRQLVVRRPRLTSARCRWAGNRASPRREISTTLITLKKRPAGTTHEFVSIFPIFVPVSTASLTSLRL